MLSIESEGNGAHEIVVTLSPMLYIVSELSDSSEMGVRSIEGVVLVSIRIHKKVRTLQAGWRR